MRWSASKAAVAVHARGAEVRWVLSALFSFFLFSQTAWAEITLPATFLRVTSVEEIANDDVLLIGAYTVKEEFHLMSSDEIIGSDKKTPSWLQAYPIEYSDIFSMDDVRFFWQMKQQPDGSWQLYSLASEKYIHAPNDKEVPIRLSNSTKTCWELKLSSDKKNFILQNKNVPSNATSRYLSIYSLDPIRFGNYTETGADNIDLYLFKLAKILEEVPGTAVLPENNSRVTLTSGKFVSAKDWSSIPSADVLLADGTIACDDNLGIWTCHYKDESGTRFVLENNEKYLNNALELATEPTEWQISHGYISTTEAHPRYLVFKERFCLLPFDEPSGAASASFSTVSPPSHIETVPAEGVKKLSGGWSAKRLASVDWQDVCSLDLTEAILPAAPLPFSSRPADTNTIIYVKADDAPLVPEDWEFVAACSEETATLLTAGSLKDGQPFRLLYPIETEESLLTYERNAYANGCWETLFVPFDADIPDDFMVEALNYFDPKTEKLNFAEQTYIPANTPLIIRYIGEMPTTERISFRLENRSGRLEVNKNADDIFAGTYLPMQISGDDAAIYMLDGSNFVRTSSGSHLMPFRAYLKLFETDKACLSVSHSDVAHTSVAPTAPHDYPDACYTLDGRKVCDRPTGEIFRTLPSGIYITKGRKTMK